MFAPLVTGFLAVILALIVVAVLFLLIRKVIKSESKSESNSHLPKLAIALLAVALVACEQVDNGHRGVQTKFGKVDEVKGSMTPDLYWYNPFTETIHEVDARTKVYEEKLHTYTKDVQQAEIIVKVNYRLQPDMVHKLFQELKPSDVQNTLLLPALQGDLKKVVGQYEAVDLIAQRGKATEQVEQMLRESMRHRFVLIDRVELSNIDYTKEFEKAVEDKVVAVQRAVEEANRTKQVLEVNKQKLNTAQTEAESVRLRANALQANPKLVEWEYAQAAKTTAEKWNGQLPTHIYGSAPLPMLNLGQHK